MYINSLLGNKWPQVQVVALSSYEEKEEQFREQVW
jgi:hypothetical protein